MKIVQINTTNGIGSTGKICLSISDMLEKENIENYVICSKSKENIKNSIVIANSGYTKIQALKSRIFGNYGFNSKFSTKKIIENLEKIKPDIVHIHNVHSHDCNFLMLFNYLRDKNIKIVYTFHDCWAFTGYCPHFSMIKCDKWQKNCENCPQKSQFSWFFDKSKSLFNKKRQALLNQNMTIVTPSNWLSEEVNKSFLKDYKVKVINNGIDLSIFKPTKSNVKEKYNISKDKFILLGVAFGWGTRKGLDVFIELSKRLDKDKFQIVLVGTDSEVDKTLPREIISINRTQNQQELAEIYSASDLFLNPTREEVLGLVNIEANACGLPIITFRTGGSPECICEKTGSVVDYNDIDSLEKEILRIEKEKPYKEEDCVKQAQNFDKDKKFKEYIELYNEVIKKQNR